MTSIHQEDKPDLVQHQGCFLGERLEEAGFPENVVQQEGPVLSKGVVGLRCPPDNVVCQETFMHGVQKKNWGIVGDEWRGFFLCTPETYGGE
jgi:hypothetical protein